MLDFLRRQVIDALARETRVTLTTGGIAGLQTSVLPCESSEMRLFVLIPPTSDHLANIDGQPECVAVAERWELRGVAGRTSPHEHPTLALACTVDAEWKALIEIHPLRLQIARPDGVGYAATIDIDESFPKKGV